MSGAPDYETDDFTIDKNVPIPTKLGGGAKAKFPWLALRVGDSFLIPDQNLKQHMNNAYAAGVRYGRKFICRRDGNGVRVWRIS